MGLMAGTYTVTEVNQHRWKHTSHDPDAIDIVSGSESLGNDFGNFELGSIHGMKFEDHDGDGEKDDGDQGLVGWTINLSDGQSTETDEDGNYWFMGLMAGTYTVTEVNQHRWKHTSHDPDAIDIVSGSESLGNDFGNFELGSIHGMKFEDHDGDGEKDDGDQGLVGWTINLSDGQSTETDEDGNYWFMGLMAGTYTVTEVNQHRWKHTSHDPDAIDIVSGSESLGNDFGNFELGSIHGMKFEDHDGDGEKDDGDQGLVGWTINLSDGQSTETDEDGNYWFMGLMAGTYTVTEVNQHRWKHTSHDPDAIDIVSGSESLGNDFGNFELGSIHGMKFEDHDGDGVKDDGDQGLVGWTINLSDGQSIETDADGNYWFMGLMAGTYTVTEVNQDGWKQTTDDPAPILIQSGSESLGNDFGNFELGSIHGMKFEDHDGDGVKDDGDQGLVGWTINLSDGQSTETDEDGNYWFMGLMAGTYTVTEVNQDGWKQTTDDPDAIDIVSGSESLGNDFGNFELGSIHGMKFEDHDGDGEKDDGDQGLVGWTINLSDGQSTETDEDGNYWFMGLMAGTYTVTEVNQDGWKQTTDDPDAIDIVSGSESLGNDFGNFELGSIHGMKFEDHDGDGEKDDGDQGLVGWTINLSDGDRKSVV